MAYPGKREGLAQKVDTAAQEAERLGLDDGYFDTSNGTPERLDWRNPMKLKVCQETTCSKPN